MNSEVLCHQRSVPGAYTRIRELESERKKKFGEKTWTDWGYGIYIPCRGCSLLVGGFSNGCAKFCSVLECPSHKSPFFVLWRIHVRMRKFYRFPLEKLKLEKWYAKKHFRNKSSRGGVIKLDTPLVNKVCQPIPRIESLLVNRCRQIASQKKNGDRSDCVPKKWSIVHCYFPSYLIRLRTDCSRAASVVKNNNAQLLYHEW